LELIKSTAVRLAEKAKSGRLWVFVVLPVLVSVLLTESIMVLTGNGSADYFWVSLITAVVATTAMVPFLYYLVSVLRETEKELSEKYHQITGILSHHKEAEQNLVQVTNFDVLTGLPNRFLFLDRLGQAISRSARSHRMVAVLLLDIDNFKTINDTLGHTHGDRLLQDIAFATVCWRMTLWRGSAVTNLSLFWKECRRLKKLH
jgi:predicted signal transduction protein with EAL and GGDEF domain